mmetsp:Transcript_93473/g.290974  ORF Transcript_93473/g.290974 Transcript_93473/m.290974 type:complete len:258 (-) Transcript_93473:397-1170(-)
MAAHDAQAASQGPHEAPYEALGDDLHEDHVLDVQQGVAVVGEADAHGVAHGRVHRQGAIHQHRANDEYEDAVGVCTVQHEQNGACPRQDDHQPHPALLGQAFPVARVEHLHRVRQKVEEGDDAGGLLHAAAVLLLQREHAHGLPGCPDEVADEAEEDRGEDLGQAVLPHEGHDLVGLGAALARGAVQLQREVDEVQREQRRLPEEQQQQRQRALEAHGQRGEAREARRGEDEDGAEARAAGAGDAPVGVVPRELTRA